MEPEAIISGGLIISLITLIFSIGVSIYSLWLNYKQAKVRDQMEVLIKEVKVIRGMLK